MAKFMFFKFQSGAGILELKKLGLTKKKKLVNARAQLQMPYLNSIRANPLKCKHNTKTRNNWNCYFKQISVRVLLKQLNYSLSVFMR